MKYFKIKSHILLIGVLFMLPACSVFETKKVVDPNLPSQESVLTNATAVQLNELGVGLQSVMRNGIQNYRLVTGSIGREMYNLSSVELTWTTELLGTTNGGFSLTTGFNASYDDFSQTRRRAELFMRGANASTALNETQKNSIRGFCNTVEAYVMLKNLNMQYQNGIRISFTDLNTPGDLLKPGPFVSYDAALTEIKRLLDLGNTQLASAGTAFAFPMTTGWAGFSTPTTFSTFNRGLAAEVMMYQKDWNGMLTALGASFMNLSGPLTTGPVFTFSTTSGDIFNPLYQQKNTTSAPMVAQALFISQAEAGDTRVPAKVALRTTPRVLNGLTGAYDVYMYPTNTSPISILRNEELILMYAEAQIQLNTPTSLIAGAAALDVIRVASGLPTLAIAKPTVLGNQAALITEMLNQRRYSLFFEGHRWFDMRRYNLLSTLPNDLPTAKVYTQLIRPFAEVQWDAKNPQ
ncbi:RagB/SusD family nutrient uptake outer membrane protein [Mucilaginibacter sp.]|uniref:RagB/SusD family nutrient uptake outer membrane protein n=1 Tax=Mucilaginibacter sp. TaxID=1882438 RepID=UPI0026050F35|nr:RagB/SusD family nutrient uptake outer membrane protein [Mucilaginibacter sp.]MDB4923993.1 RagB/SusD family nutrient uptake outer membrane protein [Mucilaginibacter sp.]